VNNEKEFRVEMASLLNRYSIDNTMNTPDYILAEFIIRSLYAYDITIKGNINHGIMES
jgi:hypothetical protein